MDIYVYSMARKKLVRISAVRRILTDTDATPQQFYDNCLDLFPIVLAPMTQAQIAAQRSLTDWEQRKDNLNTQTYRVTERMNIMSEGFEFDRTVVPANLLPDSCPQILPLLPAWKLWGAALYGTNSFEFGFNQTLRRDAVPMQTTVGHHIHSDTNLGSGYCDRQLSIFSICADPLLESAMPGRQDWWTTQWHDMRALTRDEVISYEMTHDTDDDFELKQSRIARRCPAIGLPANHHVVMPSWFLHRASNLFDAPENYDDLFPLNRPQPKAYVSHAVLISKS